MRATVLGATGFVGRAVVRDLLLRGVAVRVAGRRPGLRPGADGRGSEGPDGVERVYADLLEPGSLHGMCDGSDVLFQLASYIGPDDGMCRAVNEHGTRAAVAEARRAGVGHVVLLSTTAVYGAGPHRGIAVGEIEAEPVSVVSRTRLAGERYVLEAGGTVLRPGLVLGRGDRWVVPALADMLRRVPARWDSGRALLSVVDVHDLARLVAGVGVSGEGLGVRHASHPTPVPVSDLIGELASHGVLDVPLDAWPLDRCLERLRATEGWVSERQFRLLAEDHWYADSQAWSAAGGPPAAHPLSGLAGAAAWYRAHMAHAAADAGTGRPAPAARGVQGKVPNSQRSSGGQRPRSTQPG
ncbi:NAD-dependent epimerase/dehydratase family protein [Streptomyces sp. NPDC001381]|uniref:NAD-dependent epimerase/dehydratase family protein n=1 Tax=Streptomyces sp. NPDC001381 TaxID=3364567 RepID=UPI0036A063AE